MLPTPIQFVSTHADGDGHDDGHSDSDGARDGDGGHSHGHGDMMAVESDDGDGDGGHGCYLYAFFGVVKELDDGSHHRPVSQALPVGLCVHHVGAV